jgi:hypothetical protein
MSSLCVNTSLVVNLGRFLIRENPSYPSQSVSFF